MTINAYKSSADRAQKLPVMSMDENVIYKHSNGSFESIVWAETKDKKSFVGLLKRSSKGLDTYQVTIPRISGKQELKKYDSVGVTADQKKLLDEYSLT